MKDFLKPTSIFSFPFLWLGLLTFWALRLVYWSSVSEPPFSDMADFERIAYGVLDHFDFSFTPFWQSYKPPTLPALGAITFGLFGRGNYFAWQMVQATLTTVGVVWLSSEIWRSTRSHWLAVGLVWVVALSKPSIFWSLKFATEGVAEGLLYMIVACWIRCMRVGTVPDFLGLGFLATVAVLNRPNYVLLIPCVLLTTILGLRVASSPERRPPFKKRALMIACFLGAVAVTWSPWIIRGYRLYGHLLLTNTSGGHSFMFDLGAVTRTFEDGHTETKTNWDLLNEAPTRFANDFESHRNAGEFFNAWYREDPARYYELVWARILNSVTDRTIPLSRVSRTDLFSSGVNNFLIDKTPFLLILGAIGLIALAMHYGAGYLILPFACIAPWLFALFVLYTPRYLDPLIPLFSFGLVAGIEVLVVALLCGCGRRPDQELHPSDADSGPGNDPSWPRAA